MQFILLRDDSNEMHHTRPDYCYSGLRSDTTPSSTTELKAARSPHSYKTSLITIRGCRGGGIQLIWCFVPMTAEPLRPVRAAAPRRRRPRVGAAQPAAPRPPRTAKRCPAPSAPSPCQNTRCLLSRALALSFMEGFFPSLSSSSFPTFSV